MEGVKKAKEKEGVGSSKTSVKGGGGGLSLCGGRGEVGGPP
jgi:hypothetical protein